MTDYGWIISIFHLHESKGIILDRMHANGNLLPVQRSTSNEDYHYGRISDQ